MDGEVLQQSRPADLALSDDQVRSFAVNGYLSLPEITGADEIAELSAFYDDVFAEPEKHGLRSFDRAPAGEAQRLAQIHSAERRFPWLLETAFFRNARRAAAQLLRVGTEEVTGYNHMLLKPARHGAVTPWHQDEEGWSLGTPARLFVHRALNCWMPLDPATLESGCMQFIPGSHLREDHYPHVDRGDGSYVRIAQGFDEAEAVACPIPPGGATFHHCRTLHYSGPNTTEQARRAMVFVFHALPARIRQPGEPTTRNPSP
jgi:ectoine hydroxylase-related dioxygenase (phytanoyl-CoA dioxygenase family)